MREITIMFPAVFAVLLAPLCATGQSTLASSQQNIEMQKLAAESGCNLCHSLKHAKNTSEELLPIGPAWEDMAKKYKGQKDAADYLVRIVLQGSGSLNRHWNGKASSVTMPPNTVEISEPDAEKLVR
jgi:cytochrome c